MTLIESFLTGEYAVTRATKGEYVRGNYVPGANETVMIRGSLQPMNPRELKLPEEGTRLKQYWNLFSDEPLLTINTKSLADSDKVEINGESYRVMSVEIWQHMDLPYYKSILYREPNQ